MQLWFNPRRHAFVAFSQADFRVKARAATPSIDAESRRRNKYSRKSGKRPTKEMPE
jgi:hypothetical protein